jgi:hypothetical protein
MRIITFAFTALQNLLMVLMAPLTLAVCAGVLICTWMIARQLHRRSRPKMKASAPPTFNEWTGEAPAEWFGA